MIKIGVLLLTVGCALGAPLTQEELAQYVARQQTAGVGSSGIPRRQAYILPQTQAAQPRQLKPSYQQAAVSYQPQAYSQEETQQYYQPQAQYVQQPAKKLIRPSQYKAPGQPEDEEDYDPNPQYQFSFDIKDDEFTNYQNRKEQREGNKISGSYSVVDADGFIRTVKYTADPLEGFKADVVREPTDIKIKIPVPTQLVPQQYQQQYQPSLRKQQAQQYLQASSPIESKPQYVLRPEQGQYQPQAKQLAYSASQQPKQVAYSVKPSALGYQQQPASSPILYQAYQQ